MSSRPADRQEVPLCGHATLAAATALFHRHQSATELHFDTRWRGTLVARLQGKEHNGRALRVAISLPFPPGGVELASEDHAAIARSTAKEAASIEADKIVRVGQFEFGTIVEVAPDVDIAALKVETAKIVSLLWPSDATDSSCPISPSSTSSPRSTAHPRPPLPRHPARASTRASSVPVSASLRTLLRGTRTLLLPPTTSAVSARHPLRRSSLVLIRLLHLSTRDSSALAAALWCARSSMGGHSSQDWGGALRRASSTCFPRPPNL